MAAHTHVPSASAHAVPTEDHNSEVADTRAIIQIQHTVAGAAIVYNPTTAIAQQVHAKDMKSEKRRDGSTRLWFTTTFTAGDTPTYIRARGTNIPVGTPHVSDAQGNPLVDVSPGGVRQRELAFRFGVNLVMYTLTGNYKADQVHVPALLERLGH